MKRKPRHSCFIVFSVSEVKVDLVVSLSHLSACIIHFFLLSYNSINSYFTLLMKILSTLFVRITIRNRVFIINIIISLKMKSTSWLKNRIGIFMSRSTMDGNPSTFGFYPINSRRVSYLNSSSKTWRNALIG